MWKQFSPGSLALFRPVVVESVHGLTVPAGHQVAVNIHRHVGRPPAGIVDAIAMRKDHRKSKDGNRGDRFEFILVQMKGGNAPRPSDKDIERLVRAKEHYSTNEVVLFEWRPNKGGTFSVLNGKRWEESTAEDIFG